MSLLQNSNAISAGGYDINNSLRFRSSASAYLNRTFGTGSGTISTFSAWVKRGTLGSVAPIMFVSPNGTEDAGLQFDGNNNLSFSSWNGAGGRPLGQLITTQVFRDPSAWYHIVLAIDTTQATSSNRLKLYVNGNQVTAFGTATYPSQNATHYWNLAYEHRLGRYAAAAGTNYIDGYMAEVNFIDGQALTPSSFGETDAVTGSWVAKKYTGTYGNNGFYLPFNHTETNENRFLYSEDFANASWTKGGSTLTSNTVVAPDGTTTADTLTDNTTTDQHLILQAISTPLVGSKYTMSIYAKANTRSQIGLTMHGEGYAVFDLSAGTVISTGGYSNVGIQSVGNGWYRCYLTITKTNDNGNIYYIIFKDGVNPYLGTGTGSIYIWGAQITYGPTLQSYIKTTIPVVTNQGTVENKVLNSEDATNATWTKVAVTTTANTTTAPNGTTTADSLLETTANSLHVLLPATSLTLAAATIHTASVYVKPINNQFIQLVLDDTATTNGGAANYDLINGTVTSSTNYGIGFGINASIKSVGSGWYRISLSTSIGSGTTARFAINAIQSGSSGLFPNYVGNASNGYYVWGMQVEENSTLGPYMPTTSSAQSKVLRIGADKSLGSTGFGYNSWISNNLSLIPGTTYDAMTDSPSLTSATVSNYCTLNPLDKAGFTIANGNLSVTAQSSASGVTGSIALPSSGKWYWECIYLTGTERFFGVINIVHTTAQLGTNGTTQWVIYGTTNAGTTIINKDGADVQTGLTAVNANNVIGIAYNADAGTIQFYNNNSVIGTAVSFTAGITYAPFITSGNNPFNNFTCSANFGQQPFAYTPPTGFKRLNTYNLPDSTILKGNRVMDAVLWTGAGQTGAGSITGLNFKPDFVWAKMRSSAISHALYNSIVGGGANKALSSNGTDSEASFNANATNGYLSSFDSNGFSYFGGSSPAYFSSNGNTYVGWAWQAGQGSTSSNTSGTITSTVSVNTTAGFSIVTYTGTGANATVGHGLGVAPSMIIVKSRSGGGASYTWGTYHISTGATKYFELNTTAAVATASTPWNNTAPTSSVFNIGTWSSVNASTQTYVAYCFTAITGFSAFGSYTGNGSADGPFIFTNFRPKFIMLKKSSDISNWTIFDTSRNPYNVSSTRLYPNLSNAEDSNLTVMDILSNGFKFRDNNDQWNTNAGTYIYMAFAENPFKNSLAR